MRRKSLKKKYRRNISSTRADREWVRTHDISKIHGILEEMSRFAEHIGTQGYAPNRVIMHPDLWRRVAEEGVLSETDQDTGEISLERIGLTQEDWRAIGNGEDIPGISD